MLGGAMGYAQTELGVVSPCPYVEVRGAAEDRGLQYGCAVSDRIALGVAHYREQLAANGFCQADIDNAASQLLPAIQAFDPQYLQEMQGIAKGSKQSLSSIVLLNARTELLQLARRRAAGRPGVDGEPDGCTGVIVMPAATRHGRLLHAQNWDWKADCAETAVVLGVIGHNGAPSLLTFTEAGGLARSGLNSAGICITANYLECERDYSQPGVPLALIRRKVLEQRHLAAALHAVYCTAKSASNNMMVSHAQGLAFDFECAPDETFQLLPQGGLLVHANHWVSEVALGKLRDMGLVSTPDSLYRDQRVRVLLEPLCGRIEARHVKGALFDRFGGEWAVCRPPRLGRSNNLSASVAMIVMEPALGIMEVAMLPALNREFQTFRLPMEFQPEPVDYLLKEP